MNSKRLALWSFLVAACGGSTASDEVPTSDRCAALDDQFDTLFRQSLTCPPYEGTCELRVDRSIDSCGYFLLGDHSNQQAVDAMGEIREEWKELRCNPRPGCATGGFLPTLPAKCGAGAGPGVWVCSEDDS